MKKGVYIHTREEHDFLHRFISQDNSYIPSGFIERLFSRSMREERKAYIEGITVGYYQGCYSNSPRGMIMQLHGNIENDDHKMFYNEFLELCKKYNVGLNYHPTKGLNFIKLVNDER